MVPYPSSEVTGNSEDARAKRKFNKVHSAARMSIERAFGILSARWRFITKHLYMIDIEDVCKTIVAACILHNICIDDDDDFFDVDNDSDDEDDESDIYEDEFTYEEASFAIGRAHRNRLNRWFSEL